MLILCFSALVKDTHYFNNSVCVHPGCKDCQAADHSALEESVECQGALVESCRLMLVHLRTMHGLS